jgi:hypothetical protein
MVTGAHIVGTFVRIVLTAPRIDRFGLMIVDFGEGLEDILGGEFCIIWLTVDS